MFVVKVGGAEGNGIDNVLIDLAPRRDYVLVHGGSNEVDRLAEALGRPIRWLTSPSGIVSRYTDRETMEVFTMALTGKLNTTIVARLQSLGAPAVGLSGRDGGRGPGPADERPGPAPRAERSLDVDSGGPAGAPPPIHGLRVRPDEEEVDRRGGSAGWRRTARHHRLFLATGSRRTSPRRH